MRYQRQFDVVYPVEDDRTMRGGIRKGPKDERPVVLDQSVELTTKRTPAAFGDVAYTGEVTMEWRKRSWDPLEPNYACKQSMASQVLPSVGNHFLVSQVTGTEVGF